jgi:hypothetical protein
VSAARGRAAAFTRIAGFDHLVSGRRAWHEGWHDQPEWPEPIVRDNPSVPTPKALEGTGNLAEEQWAPAARS